MVISDNCYAWTWVRQQAQPLEDEGAGLRLKVLIQVLPRWKQDICCDVKWSSGNDGHWGKGQVYKDKLPAQSAGRDL